MAAPEPEVDNTTPRLAQSDARRRKTAGHYSIWPEAESCKGEAERKSLPRGRVGKKSGEA